MRPSSRSGAGARPRGVTLLELLVALAVIALVTAAALPALRPGREDGALAAARALAGAYDRGALAASRRRTPVRVALHAASGRWLVYVPATDAGPADTLDAGRLPAARGTRVVADVDADGWAVATFEPLGRADGRAVLLADAAGRHLVVLDPWTGGARVAPW